MNIFTKLPLGKQLGAQIRLARTAQDMEQVDVAKRCGITVGTVSNIERGHWSKPETVEKVMRALGVEEVTLKLPQQASV